MLFLPESILEACERVLEERDEGKLAAEKACRQVLQLNPLDYSALLELSLLRQEDGDLAAAEALEWKAAEAHPCLWLAWMELADLFEKRGEMELSQGLAELGLRKMLLDPESLVEMDESPESFADYTIPDLQIPDPRERIETMVEVLHGRRDGEPAEVTERLRRQRSLMELQEAENLEPALVDAIVAEGEAMVPLLVGVMRDYAQADLLDGDEGTVENAMALMGEIGSQLALAPLLEFGALDDKVLSGAAGWAFDRIVELQPECAEQTLLELAPHLEGAHRLALAARLVFWPRWKAADRLFEILAESAESIPAEERGAFFQALTMALIVARRREGLAMARGIVRRNAGLMDRRSRRECDEQIELFAEGDGNLLQTFPDPERSAWTVYQICAGEAVWPSNEDYDEEDGERDDEMTLPPEPVHRPILPGRNDPCWCGSGKKYKKCHLDSDRSGQISSV